MLEENVNLAGHSNYKIGGPARYFAKPETTEELVTVVRDHTGPLFVLGGGTNVLFPDEGFDGLILKPRITTIERDGTNVRVGAGALMSDLLDFTVREGLSGLEWAGGLPGTVGGAIYINAGAFGGETKDSATQVTSLGVESGTPELVKRTNSECNFEYRGSVFRKQDPTGLKKKEVILEAVFSLKPGDKEAIRKAIEEKISYRKSRQPLEYPNIGSIFKNIDVRNVSSGVREKFGHKIKHDPFPLLPAAVLLDAAGLKGVSSGGAMISPKHPNFIVNVLGASSRDVKSLIALVKERIKKVFGVELEEEVIILPSNS